MNKKADKFNFVQIYYLIGRLSGMTTPDSNIGEVVRELEKELDKALGYDSYYVDTSFQNDREALEEHVKGDVLDERLRDS